MSYAEAWKENRRRWKWFLLWWVGGLITFVVVSLLASLVVSPQGREQARNVIFFIVGPGWVLGTMTMAARLFYMFRCPRCEELFYMKWLYGNPYTRHCLHCGLRKGTVEPPEAE